MPDEHEVNLRLTEEAAGEASHHGIASEYAASDEFGDFIGSLLDTVDDGVPLAHVLSHVVMELFQPGFVIIGSPQTRKTSEGYNLPNSLGVAIGGNSDMTKSDLVILMREFADQLEESANPERLLDD